MIITSLIAVYLIHVRIFSGVTTLVDCSSVTLCYLLMKRLFTGKVLVPYGKARRSFVEELARLYQAFGGDSALHSIALMACSVMQPLLLQKPCKRSKAKDTHNTLVEDWNFGGRRGHSMNY